MHHLVAGAGRLKWLRGRPDNGRAGKDVAQSASAFCRTLLKSCIGPITPLHSFLSLISTHAYYHLGAGNPTVCGDARVLPVRPMVRQKKIGRMRPHQPSRWAQGQRCHPATHTQGSWGRDGDGTAEILPAERANGSRSLRGRKHRHHVTGAPGSRRNNVNACQCRSM